MTSVPTHHANLQLQATELCAAVMAAIIIIIIVTRQSWLCRCCMCWKQLKPLPDHTSCSASMRRDRKMSLPLPGVTGQCHCKLTHDTGYGRHSVSTLRYRLQASSSRCQGGIPQPQSDPPPITNKSYCQSRLMHIVYESLQTDTAVVGTPGRPTHPSSAWSHWKYVVCESFQDTSWSAAHNGQGSPAWSSPCDT
jgi:hypothetical protein